MGECKLMNIDRKAMLLFGWLVVVVITVSCCPNLTGIKSGETVHQLRKIEIADGEMQRKNYTKFGVSIVLPKDLMNKMEWVDKEQDKQSYFEFVIKKVSMAKYNLGDMEIIGGHVNVFSPEQYAHWREFPWDNDGELFYRKGRWVWTVQDEVFDKLQVYDIPRKWGEEETVYRLDHKAADGRVFQAIILRMHYTDNQSVIDEEVTLITNILNSVRFIKE
jgi:hypothetical protein